MHDITSQMEPQISTPKHSTGNNLSASLASPTAYSKPILLIPATPGGDETYLDEDSPIGLYPGTFELKLQNFALISLRYGLVPNMFLELRFTNPLLSVASVSLTHTGDQPMYLQLLVPEFLSWRNIAVTPLTTVGKVFGMITSRIEPYLIMNHLPISLDTFYMVLTLKYILRQDREAILSICAFPRHR